MRTTPDHTEYIPTCRLNLLDRVPPSVKFNSSTWTVEDKCGLRGYGQRPKKKGKAKLRQHTSAEPSLVGSCRKSARHPVIAQNAIALLQKSYVCLRGVCWCQAFAVSTGHIGSTDYGTAVPAAALLNFGPSQTSRPFFGGYRGIGLCFFFTKTHSLYNFLISIPNMASPNSPPENGASETEPPRNENSSSSSSSPLPSASVGENLAQALKDLARGEQTATALENDLTKLESKLDEILASLGVNIDDLEEGEDSTNADKQSNGEVDGKK
ncbi:uncharacterized protein PODANS_1_7400 [Podospora anserina S mat+]|uniref:Podospora anserina S mat+ genomic DNA chromosome 1, supercontig 1 n=1 Tax=Podospora anserina (strain S / ATCC MYA-4624 / DSM 980 / FGSC 10383) TaxID=515849 RepID=B2A8U4_PODAN|nr:uncharacterized protein PODANS_1_7400 [Podospora anserina S mat+]CAP60445.1 unnamed protein product [Podospora anserina S mat+]CDP23090.1 Putative protein of unknown function [Podospora anserina S mat+]